MNSNDLKLAVKEKYGEIAQQSMIQVQSSRCGTSGCCGELEFSMIGDEYQDIKGYNPEADLGLGCGIPTNFAAIKKGDRILDLGSGAGNDCFVARAIVGELPDKLRKGAEMYAGCVSGAIDMDKYLEIYLSKQEIEGFKNGVTGIFSKTISGYKL